MSAYIVVVDRYVISSSVGNSSIIQRDQSNGINSLFGRREGCVCNIRGIHAFVIAK